MSPAEIAQCWKRAEQLATQIWEAYVTEVGLESAKKAQKTLAHWIKMVKEYGIVYNGYYDEYLALKL